VKFWLNSPDVAAFQHAKKLTSHYAKSFYFSARILPESKRWATYALYGFCRYADNLIDNPRSRTLDELLMEVDFLEKELQIAYRTGESEHPVVKPFIIVARKYGIPIDYPLDLLKGVKMDLQNTRYETFEDLYVFCYRVAGVVGLMMTHVLGYKDKKAFEYAEKLGIAMQLTNILRDVKEDKEMGRIYLPQEDLRRFGITDDDIMNERMDTKMHRMMQFQVDRARRYYVESDPGVEMLERESQFAIYSASKIYAGILLKIETQDYNPFLGRVFVPQFKKLRILLNEIFWTRLLPVRNTYAFHYYKVAEEQQ